MGAMSKARILAAAAKNKNHTQMRHAYVDVPLASLSARSGNRVVFGNAQYELGPGVKAGVELSCWVTEYPNALAGFERKPSDLRLQMAIQGGSEAGRTAHNSFQASSRTGRSVFTGRPVLSYPYPRPNQVPGLCCGHPSRAPAFSIHPEVAHCEPPSCPPRRCPTQTRADMQADLSKRGNSYTFAGQWITIYLVTQAGLHNGG